MDSERSTFVLELSKDFGICSRIQWMVGRIVRCIIRIQIEGQIIVQILGFYPVDKAVCVGICQLYPVAVLCNHLLVMKAIHC